ncbi:MAG: ATP12 family protein [Roseiarcus sp.]|jgi:chaperone required for assembly of F1-ATPase
MSDDFSPGDPMRAAQRNMRPAVMRRFYAVASVAPVAAGFALRLDGRGARTPAGNPLVFPTLALAELAASEWTGQGEAIDPATMPVARIANSAIDGVAAAIAETRAELAAYAEADLLCYRAGAPQELVEAQASAYDPVLDWAHEAYGARFLLAEGVTHRRQPERALQAINAELRAIDEPFALAALHVMTTLTGSILLALGVFRGGLTAPEAWRIAHVDEDFQIGQWGEDDEAMARRAARWREMAAAAKIAAALGR